MWWILPCQNGYALHTKHFSLLDKLHSGYTVDDVISVYSHDRTTFSQTITPVIFFKEIAKLSSWTPVFYSTKRANSGIRLFVRMLITSSCKKGKQKQTNSNTNPPTNNTNKKPPTNNKTTEELDSIIKLDH